MAVRFPAIIILLMATKLKVMDLRWLILSTALVASIQGWSLIVKLSALCFYVFATHDQFTVGPVPVVQAQGLNAVFECRYPGALNYNWRFNGYFPIY